MSISSSFSAILSSPNLIQLSPLFGTVSTLLLVSVSVILLSVTLSLAAADIT